MNDDELLDELRKALTNDEHRNPPDDRVARVRAAAERMRGAAAPAEPAALPGGSGRRFLLVGGAAAGVGAVAGYLGRGTETAEPVAQPPVVPTEDIAFTATGVQVSQSALINHGWGTELLLDVTGLLAGVTYTVDYRTRSGEVRRAGSMLGVADTVVKCRFTQATLRAELARIAVTDADDREILVADL